MMKYLKSNAFLFLSRIFALIANALVLLGRILALSKCVVVFFFRIIRAVLKIRRYIIYTSCLFLVLSPIIAHCAPDFIIWTNAVNDKGIVFSESFLNWLNTCVVAPLRDNTWTSNLNFKGTSHPEVFKKISVALSNLFQSPEKVELFRAHLNNFISTAMTNKFQNSDGTINFVLYEILALLTSGKVNLNDPLMMDHLILLNNAFLLEIYSFAFAMCSNPDNTLGFKSTDTKVFRRLVKPLHIQAEEYLNKAITGLVNLTEREDYGGLCQEENPEVRSKLVKQEENPEVRSKLVKDDKFYFWAAVGTIGLASLIFLTIGIGVGYFVFSSPNIPVEAVSMGKSLLPSTDTSLILRS